MFSYDSSKNEFLTKDAIREIAPSVFTEKADSSSTSKHYVHIPTENVIDDMASLGWGVVDAKQVKARKNQGYQKHMVVFGNDNLVVDLTYVGENGLSIIKRFTFEKSKYNVLVEYIIKNNSTQPASVQMYAQLKQSTITDSTHSLMPKYRGAAYSTTEDH